MADLPYKFTICPPNEAPKLFTASCLEIGRLLATSINGDLTIDDRRNGLWQSWERSGVVSTPVEEMLHNLLQERKNERT